MDTLIRAAQYLGVFSATYLIFVISVNVGYINVVGYWAAELFSLSDTLQVNMLLLRNIIFYLGAILAVMFFIFIPIVLSLGRFLNKITWQPDFDLAARVTFSLMKASDWQGYIWVLMVLILFAIASSQAEGRGVFLELLPMLFMTALQCGYLFYLRKKEGWSEMFFLLGLLANIIFLGHSLGKAWARDDRTNSEKVVSVYEKGGSCVVRRMTRVLGGVGILFYNEYARSYEFRRFDDIRSITPRNTCSL